MGGGEGKERENYNFIKLFAILNATRACEMFTLLINK